MSNKKGYALLIATLIVVFLTFSLMIVYRNTSEIKPKEYTLPVTVDFYGERVVQVDKGEEFLISDHLKAIDSRGEEVPVIVDGYYDLSLPDIYFLEIRTDLKEGNNIYTNFTLVVFSEEDFIY